MYLTSVSLKRNNIEDWGAYPFNIPFLSGFKSIDFSPSVTFIVGENGSGKSTLIEAIAVCLGFNPEGGTRNFNFATNNSHSNLYNFLKPCRSFLQPKDGFFLRAESFYNVASNIEELNNLGGKSIFASYGGKSLHAQSHGESFMSLVLNRFSKKGLFILDEPESALSPQRQLTLLSRMSQLVEQNSQFIVATHSPILLAYPNAFIYEIDDKEIKRVQYQETQAYQITKLFLEHPEAMLNELIEKQE